MCPLLFDLNLTKMHYSVKKLHQNITNSFQLLRQDTHTRRTDDNYEIHDVEGSVKFRSYLKAEFLSST